MTDTRDEPLYMISVIAKMLDIHPQTLRLYEKEGLITPQRTRGNTRLYSENDIERIRNIMTLTRELGVNLAGVEIILSLKNQISELKGTFEDFIQFIQQEMTKEYAGFDRKFREALVKSPHQQVVKSVLNKEENVS